jgi:hypothetical protein
MEVGHDLNWSCSAKGILFLPHLQNCVVRSGNRLELTMAQMVEPIGPEYLSFAVRTGCSILL